MTKTFDKYLADANRIRKVNILDTYERRKSISTYYMNNANELRAGAIATWHASAHAAFYLLAGLSIELLLKATAKILGRPDQRHHRLLQLSIHVGLEFDEDHSAILENLAEAIYWQSRYPVPGDSAAWNAASKIRQKLWRESPGFSIKLFSPDPRRAIDLDHYNEIWGIIFDAYWQAKSVIYEP